MKAAIVFSALLWSGACGGGRTEMPPPAGPEPAAVVEKEEPAEPAVDEPSAEERGAVWGERVEKAFTALTVSSVVPAQARATAAAAWAALELPPDALPADDAALGAALRQRAAEQIGGGALPAERAWAAIAAMTEVADNVHVMFLDAEHLGQLGGSIEGNPFVTPGVMVHWTPEQELVVSEVLPGAAAAAAGIVVGDVITGVNGRPPRRVAPLFGVMFGPAGEKAVLGVRRAGTDTKVTVALTPFLHPVESHHVVKGDVGLLRLYFCGLGEAPERNHVAATRAALADFDGKKVKRVVIDLRGNMGGGGVAPWASIFTKADPILLAQWRGESGATEQEPWARNGDPWPKARPIAVLVDEQTISCGEMLAYALAEHGVARVFGQPTGDALHVPEPVDLGDGHVIMVPTAEVLGPRTRTVPEGHRVTPHELVPNRTVGELMAGKDPQLDAAMRWLARQKVPAR